MEAISNTRHAQYESSPIENACKAMDSKNQELINLIYKCEQNPIPHLKSLSQILQGAICVYLSTVLTLLTGLVEAAVSGGIPKYIEVSLVIDMMISIVHVCYPKTCLGLFWSRVFGCQSSQKT